MLATPAVDLAGAGDSWQTNLGIDNTLTGSFEPPSPCTRTAATCAEERERTCEFREFRERLCITDREDRCRPDRLGRRAGVLRGPGNDGDYQARRRRPTETRLGACLLAGQRCAVRQAENPRVADGRPDDLQAHGHPVDEPASPPGTR